MLARCRIDSSSPTIFAGLAPENTTRAYKLEHVDSEIASEQCQYKPELVSHGLSGWLKREGEAPPGVAMR